MPVPKGQTLVHIGMWSPHGAGRTQIVDGRHGLRRQLRAELLVEFFVELELGEHRLPRAHLGGE